MIQDWGTSIFNALSNAVNLILTFIPKLIGFLIILIVGLIIAALLAKAVTFLLRKVGFDRMSDRIGLTRFEQRMGVRMDTAGILGKVVYWFIVLIFLVPAADALGVPAVSNILNELVAYIPNVFVAILVLFLGALAGAVVGDLVRGAVASANIGNPNLFAGIARWAIIAFAALIALEQLKITPDLINELFGAIVLALAIAFGLAFGLGGQDAARRWLARGEGTMTAAASQISAQQSVDQARITQQQAEQMRANQVAQAQTYQAPPAAQPQYTQQQAQYAQPEPPYTQQYPDNTATAQRPSTNTNPRQ
jgi:Mechanosensitive ion channel, conserved TM helix